MKLNLVSRISAGLVNAPLTLGMRGGEVLGLRWSDIDFDGRAFRVNQSVQRLSIGSDEGKKSELRSTEIKTDGRPPNDCVTRLGYKGAAGSSRPPGAGPAHRRHVLEGSGLGLYQPKRAIARADSSASRLQGASKKSRIARHTMLSRSSPQCRVTVAGARRSSARDHGIARALINHSHDERLRPCHAGHDARRR
jgi:hypothetical protein